MNWRDFIALEPGKRSGQPRIRGTRITVADVFGFLSSGMSAEAIVADFPQLSHEAIQACFAYAADRERHSRILVAA
jgi:uncharacterized protein (DUF433 family)